MSEKQRTIAQPVSFSGKGLHTGLKVSMTINPTEANHGICFRRTDLEGMPTIPALADYVVDTSRSTTIGKGDVKVSTIEHLMAALYGSGVDNAVVDIDGPEVPIMDGSAADFVKGIGEAGTVEVDAERKYYTIRENFSFRIPEKNVEISAYPDDKFSINLNIDFGSSVVGRQFAMLDSYDGLVAEIAKCRTFVFLHEIEPLIEHNMIKGGDIDNAIVIVEKPIPEEQQHRLNKLFGREDITVNGKGYLNNIQLRYENEIARHKLLDLFGDLALAGIRVKGKIFANRPGHKANTEFARMIRRNVKRDAHKPDFVYDPNKEPLYDINAIKHILPHRPPFLLVDKILHLDETSVIGIKNVTMNEPFFVGHFPNEPVMPGVLQIEAMAQCGGILALSSVPDPENYSTYFLKMNDVKFKRKVVPGDTLLFILKLAEPIRRGIVQMECRAYVGDTLACEAMLVAQVAKTMKNE